MEGEELEEPREREGSSMGKETAEQAVRNGNCRKTGKPGGPGPELRRVGEQGQALRLGQSPRDYPIPLALLSS